MQLIIIHKDKNSTAGSAGNLLRFAVSSEPVAGIIIDGLSTSLHLNGDKKPVILVPEEWHIQSRANLPKTEQYKF